MGLERTIEQEAREAEYAVHRRTDLVAHHGAEVALGPVCCLRCLEGEGEFVRSVFDALLERPGESAQLRIGIEQLPALALQKRLGLLASAPLALEPCPPRTLFGFRHAKM